MFAKLFLLFAILPIVEIALLINLGEIIGGWNTVAIVIITAFFGAHLVRQQGLHTMLLARQKMQQGQLPGQEMAEGLLLLVAGVLLVTPGFITDIIGFLFALPMTRPVLARSLMKQFSGNISMHNVHRGSNFESRTSFHEFHQYHHDDGFQGNTSNNDPAQHEPSQQKQPNGNITIEGEYQKKDKE
ncbi:MAG: FxsA family protein [Aestuariibacter sp.]